MSYEPLHHKYRPQTFADLVGQNAIATTLTNAITSERIAPAYLFTGPRGTGKTSSARILAKSLNCLASEQPTPTPCGVCEVCRAIARGSALDVIEIDAASNTGVDNIREIIERTQFAPVQCRYKVYVIDECHMLSVSAFNALLKTLEEPPERVVFVLATTDPQRVLPTIISRCQRFDYRRIPLEAMVVHLKKIAAQEQINIEDEAISLVAQIANGGLRDAESLLDQLSLLAGTITPEKVWDLVGAVPEKDLLKLMQAIAANQPQTVIEQCRYLMNRGREPLVVLQNLASFYLNLLIAKTAPNRPDMVAVTSPTWQVLCEEAKRWNLEIILQGQKHLKDSEIQLKNTSQPRLWLEVTLLSLLASAHQPIAQPQVNLKTAAPQQETPPISPQPTPIQPPPIKTEIPQPKPSQETTKSQTSTPESVTPAAPAKPEETGTEIASTEEIWQAVLKQLSGLTQALVKSHFQLISLEENVARIAVKTEPLLKHAQGKVNEIEAAFTSVFHRKIKVHFQVGIAPQSSSNSLSQTPVNPAQQSTQEQSLTPSIPPVNINNNGHKVAIKPEIKPNPPTISEPSPQENGNISTSSVNQSDSLSPNLSQGEVDKAAETLAKLFEGEIVILNNKLEEDEAEMDIKETQANPITHVNNQIESNLPKKESPPINKPIIRGRPDLSNLTDEDDLDF